MRLSRPQKKGKTKKNETTITIFFNKLFLYYCCLDEFKIQGGGGDRMTFA